MTTNSRIRLLSTALVLGSAALGFSAAAQTTTTSTTTVKEAPPAQGTGPVQRAEDATKRAGHATVNGVKHAGHATANGARKVGGAVRHTGEKIGSKLPPEPVHAQKAPEPEVAK